MADRSINQDLYLPSDVSTIVLSLVIYKLNQKSFPKSLFKILLKCNWLTKSVNHWGKKSEKFLLLNDFFKRIKKVFFTMQVLYTFKFVIL